MKPVIRCMGMAGLLLATAGIWSASAQFTPPYTGVPADVKSVNDRYMRAVLTGDGNGLTSATTDDFVFVNDKGAELKRDAVIAGWKTGAVKYTNISTLEEVIRVYGDSAIMTGVTVSKGTASDQPFERTARFVRVFVKTPKGWLAAHSQVTAGK